MIPHSRVAAARAVLIVTALLTLACERVPLLAPSGSVITLTTTTTVLPFNGTTQIVAQVLESAGHPPHSGTHIIFTTTLGAIQPSEVETDISGQAIVTFNAGTASGTATITAASGGASVTAAGALKILVGTAAVGRVIVSASPPLVPALGGSSIITALVIDLNGNALTSVPVTFSTTAGVLSASLATTDRTGAAQTVLTTSTQATVTASVGAGPTSTPPPTTGTPPSTGTPTTPTTPTSGQASGSVTVSPKAQPTVSLTVVTTNPTAGTDVAFTATVAPATGTAIQNVTADFGDGSTKDLGAATSTSISLHHVYQVGGTYTVVVTVTDSNGSVGAGVTTIFVQTATPLTVLLSATSTPAGANTVESFTATVVGLGNSVVVNYHWIFGSTLGTADTTGNQQTRTYTAGAGTITVTVTITTSTGATQSGQTVIVVP